MSTDQACFVHVCVLQKALHECVTPVKIRVVNFRMEINFAGLDRVTSPVTDGRPGNSKDLMLLRQ